MDVLAGGAPRTGRSVRGVARWGHNTRCGTNNAAFAARVDLDKLLAGTELATDFGQSRFAIARGQRVERLGREDGYQRTFEALDEAFGYPESGRATLNLRSGFGLGNRALDTRADATQDAVAAIVAGRTDAPNIIDGAVLRAEMGGYNARLEADTLGARRGPEFHVVEFKSWAKVDGRFADAAKVGEALRQMGLYSSLVGQLIEDVGGDPDGILSDVGLLVTPRNVGLQLVGTTLSLGRARVVAETTLAALPDPAAYAGEVDPAVGFGPVGALDAPEDGRLDALERVTTTYGTTYQQSCLSSCGLARFCRNRARHVDAPEVCGSNVVRMLPGVRGLRRADELARGVAPDDEERETGVADALVETEALLAAALRQVAEGAA